MRKATLALVFMACILASSLLTYIVVSGYWYRLGYSVPNKPSIAITDVFFPLNDTHYFNLTVINPSYSLKPVNLTSVMIITPELEVEEVKFTSPSLPLVLDEGEVKTLKCYWRWENYTGEKLTVIAFLDYGSSAAVRAEVPFVELQMGASFNATSPFWFLLNVTNVAESVANVSITRVDVVLANGTRIRDLPTEPDVSEEEPHLLEPNSTLTLNCTWDWLEYRNKTLTIVALSKEGYTGYLNYTTPPEVLLKITEVTFFKQDDTYYFNLTVFNEPISPAPAKINNVTILIEEELFVVENVTPSIKPFYLLQPNSSVVLTCAWNWSLYEGRNATITVSTVLGYSANATVQVSAGTTKLAPSELQAPRGSGPPGVNGRSARICSSPASAAPRLCAPRARRRTLILCALSRSRRSNRLGWPPPMPSL